MAGPKLESRKATDIAVIEHVGPYDKIPWDEYIPRLYGWAKEQKVMPGFYPIGIYHDVPESTTPEKLRSDVAIAFKGKGKASRGIVLKKLPAMKVATISHKGPGSEYKDTYARLHQWIAEKGLRAAGPPIEIYSRKPEVLRGRTILHAKVMIPVKRK